MSDLSTRPLFVVWRAAPGLPPGFMPRDMEGRWDYRPRQDGGVLARPGDPPPRAVGIRTSRIEHREDGASAEVWEVHPVDGNYDPDPANRLPLW